MPTRTPLIAANWKMHPAPKELDTYRSREHVDVLVLPTAFDLKTCIDAGLMVGSQYGHSSDSGAHTGDISMAMLAHLGCTYVLCGHSERRQYHCETNAYIGEQTAAAVKHELHPIVCIGESEKERDAGESKSVVKEQLDIVLARIGEAKITVAYEPVWAISGGDPSKASASAANAQEMHAYIRSLLPKGDTTRILYGGSMKPENAEELLQQSDIDGGLVGGASLDPAKFRKILDVAQAL